ncbi:putative NEDD4 family-interacting protein 2 [Sesbania bispinosa]|nr:putative NEDD4 family-interacting protein 2 [Sesbania bispinosa]
MITIWWLTATLINIIPNLQQGTLDRCNTTPVVVLVAAIDSKVQLLLPCGEDLRNRIRGGDGTVREPASLSSNPNKDGKDTSPVGDVAARRDYGERDHIQYLK